MILKHSYISTVTVPTFENPKKSSGKTRKTDEKEYQKKFHKSTQ